MADNFMTGFSDGYRNGTIIRQQKELEAAHQSIERWAAREIELMERVSRMEKERDALKAERDALKTERNQLQYKVSSYEKSKRFDSQLLFTCAVNYMGLQGQLGAAYEVLDAPFGVEGNPLREPADENSVSEHKLKEYEGTPVSKGQAAFYEAAERALGNASLAPYVAYLQAEFSKPSIWSHVSDPWKNLEPKEAPVPPRP